MILNSNADEDFGVFMKKKKSSNDEEVAAAALLFVILVCSWVFWRDNICIIGFLGLVMENFG